MLVTGVQLGHRRFDLHLTLQRGDVGRGLVDGVLVAGDVFLIRHRQFGVDVAKLAIKLHF